MPYEVTTDPSRFDLDLIHRFLSTESYWAKGIPREVVERSIENALCFAVFSGKDQAAFARVVTDYAVFAYVGDVFVVNEHRGRGVAKLIMEAIRTHPRLQTLRRWHLLTYDAHGLYRQFGFHELEKPARHMEITVHDPYGSTT